MSSTDRQNRLLVAEDWKRIYQSFRNAEFKSYDFDNLRRIMISYIKENYPEDFNDYIESSEYIALIDLIAFLGQNLAFRIDLNARENFLDLAERKESILRLARLLSYNTKRNQCAHGLLKIVGVSTTENVMTANNINLQNQTIIWNDSTNPDWNEQFTRILNSALPDGNTIGRPLKYKNINGVPTRQYRFRGSSTTTPVYPYRKNIKGTTVDFEVVSCDIDTGAVVEEAPMPGRSLAFLYREDGQGPAGNNTGYFCQFKQGAINNGVFNITNSAPNQVVAIDSPNINNTDVWLYSLDSKNNETRLWKRVDSVEGNNVIYNTVSSDERNIYSVLSRINDKISLIFADGVFGELPQGNFRIYYRTSKNKSMIISPASMRNVVVKIPYVSKTGVIERLTLTMSLKYTVSNSSVSETDASIKRNAPATYYTQNRLITAEDYQLGTDSVHQEIIKSKTVNRTASGISRYFDLVDATGKYSDVTLFGDDGVLYKHYENSIIKFSFSNITDVEGTVYNTIEPAFRLPGVNSYYMDRFPRATVNDFGIKWSRVSYKTNSGTGVFIGQNANPVQLGNYSNNNLRYVKTNSLIKFTPPAGYVFYNGEIVPAGSAQKGSSDYKWSRIVHVLRDGTEIDHGVGAVTLNDNIPDGALMSEIITPLPTRLSEEVRRQVINQIASYKTFGIRYDQPSGEWQVITQNNLNPGELFSTINTGDTSNRQLDSSWMFIFRTNGYDYSMTYRSLEYVFESDRQVQFYYDADERARSNNVLNPDVISVLDINSRADSDTPINTNMNWKIVKEYTDLSGYVNNKKVRVSLYDSDNDGVIDDPDLFRSLVNESHNTHDKIVFLQAVTIYNKTNDYEYVPVTDTNIVIFDSRLQLRNLEQYTDGQLFYFIEENSFSRLVKSSMSLISDTKYRAHFGRSGLKFKYVHHSDYNSRIDPSASNIMDTFILTGAYDAEYRQWISGRINQQPLPPSSDELYITFGSQLSKIKSISDEIIYHPVKYRVLFGKHAPIENQAVFKVVKNTELVINDNELKSRVISAINRYFSLDNWDFGETFYFSELAAYVMTQLSPALLTFIIVPVQDGISYGALHEIHAESDEIFISDATVDNVEIIDEITATNIRSLGDIRKETAMMINRVTS